MTQPKADCPSSPLTKGKSKPVDAEGKKGLFSILHNIISGVLLSAGTTLTLKFGHNKSGILLAIAGVADQLAIRIISSTITKRFPPWKVWSAYGLAVLALGIGGIVLVLRLEPASTTEDRVAKKTAGEVVKMLPPSAVDYIEGTQISRAQLKELLPLGYVVFFLKDKDRLIWEVNPGDRVEFKAAWEKTIITPDFANNTVSLSMFGVSISLIENGRRHEVMQHSAVAYGDVPMKLHDLVKVRRPFSATWLTNVPDMLFGLIGGNQSAPVFVVGFRFLPAENQNPSDAP